MTNYTQTFQTPAGAMQVLNLDNTDQIFTLFINKTYYEGGVIKQKTLMQSGGTKVTTCHYCDKNEVFVVNNTIVK
jgi:hypothetical protein